MNIVDKFGELFGWNYYETNTYLFLILQPTIYIILGILTIILNLHIIFKYKSSLIVTIIFVSIAVIGVWHSWYWWREFSINTLPFLDNPTQLAKNVIKQLWQEGKTCEGYEKINFQRYVFYFLWYITIFILINIPQLVYKRNIKQSQKLQSCQ